MAPAGGATRRGFRGRGGRRGARGPRLRLLPPARLLPHRGHCDVMHEELRQDQEARERAVDPARSVILQAPAGSGKTTVLIERLLVLLTQAEAPEEILAITFTRKAAAEMALRVAQILKGPLEAASEPRAQHLQQLAHAV